MTPTTVKSRKGASSESGLSKETATTESQNITHSNSVSGNRVGGQSGTSTSTTSTADVNIREVDQSDTPELFSRCHHAPSRNSLRSSSIENDASAKLRAELRSYLEDLREKKGSDGTLLVDFDREDEYIYKDEMQETKTEIISDHTTDFDQDSSIQPKKKGKSKCDNRFGNKNSEELSNEILETIPKSNKNAEKTLSKRKTMNKSKQNLEVVNLDVPSNFSKPDTISFVPMTKPEECQETIVESKSDMEIVESKSDSSTEIDVGEISSNLSEKEQNQLKQILTRPDLAMNDIHINLYSTTSDIKSQLDKIDDKLRKIIPEQEWEKKLAYNVPSLADLIQHSDDSADGLKRRKQLNSRIKRVDARIDEFCKQRSSKDVSHVIHPAYAALDQSTKTKDYLRLGLASSVDIHRLVAETYSNLETETAATRMGCTLSTLNKSNDKSNDSDNDKLNNFKGLENTRDSQDKDRVDKLLVDVRGWAVGLQDKQRVKVEEQHLQQNNRKLGLRKLESLNSKEVSRLIHSSHKLRGIADILQPVLYVEEEQTNATTMEENSSCSTKVLRTSDRIAQNLARIETGIHVEKCDGIIESSILWDGPVLARLRERDLVNISSALSLSLKAKQRRQLIAKLIDWRVNGVRENEILRPSSSSTKKESKVSSAGSGSNVAKTLRKL